MTSPTVHSGSFDFSEIGLDQTIALIHGGAGPEDPKGDATSAADKEIRRILENAGGKNKFAFDFHPNLTRAETTCLNYAEQLELNPIFNAGYGAALQRDGVARVSASFMESQRQKFSAVMNVRGIKYPSELAYYLQSKRFDVLDQQGASELAEELDIQKEDLVTEFRHERWRRQNEELQARSQEAPLSTGTVGCTSLDSQSNLAAVTSTGGVGNETVGRVGDTPTIAGNYCNSSVAVSCTGVGEQIVNQAFAAKTATRVVDGQGLRAAAEKGFAEALNANYRFAAIALHYDKSSKKVFWCAGSTSDFFVWGLRLSDTTITFRDYLKP